MSRERVVGGVWAAEMGVKGVSWAVDVVVMVCAAADVTLLVVVWVVAVEGDMLVIDAVVVLSVVSGGGR